MQCFKCQAHGHIEANCENTQRCPRCVGDNHIKDCNKIGPHIANCNEKHSAAYKGCPKYKEAKQQARAASYAEALKNKPENKDKERAQKIAIEAQTRIEKNLQNNEESL